MIGTCNIIYCLVDGVWELWSDWGPCSLTCGGGRRHRNRLCNGPFHGGKPCPGEGRESQTCNSHRCPEDGILAQWNNWESCDVSCGGGTRQRHRDCIGPFYGGRDCTASLTELSPCNVHNCPIDGVYNDWSAWLECSVSCGGGISLRNRTCTGPFYGGLDCEGPPVEERGCNDQPCPVDGEWETWLIWSDCSVSCGGGEQQRERVCHGTAHGGAYCAGEHTEDRLCNTHHCPVDGVFDQWSAWGECSLSCGVGSQVRDRVCIGPFHGGLDCEGAYDQAQDCNTHPCPVDGYYQPWADWGTCSKSCGGGRQYRDRKCVEPLHGGQDCQGDAEQMQKCQEQPCPIDGYWDEWAAWRDCSVSCGGGIQGRSRECVAPQHGGAPCQGPQDDSQECNTQHCPIDGVYQAWGGWSGCNVTCGGGLQVRTRECTAPMYGGLDCQGPREDYLSCSDNPCPIPGLWHPWSPWSPCPVTCGGGSKQRERVCDMTSYGDLTAPCVGEDRQLVDCHTFDCQPLARTCTEWGERGLEEDTEADIDVDGPGHMTLEPVQVFCDMTSKPGVGITVIGHDQEERHQVQGWEGAREYEVELEYNITFEHAVAVVDQSGYCEQYISWECKAALIHNYNDNNKVTTGWLNRTAGVADYFGGAFPGSQSCACGVNSTCVEGKPGDKPLACNCDKNDEQWRQDDGYLTFKDDLPVYAFVAGDTGGQTEDGFHIIGPLRCQGHGKPAQRK